MGSRGWYCQSCQLWVLWKVLKEPASAAPWDRVGFLLEGLVNHFLTLADSQPLPQPEPCFSFQSEPCP